MKYKDRMIKVFEHVQELDIFRVTPEYESISMTLGIQEWNPVVWIGRFFTMDNDYGEHWFDNWDEREELTQRIAERYGLPQKPDIQGDKILEWYRKVDSIFLQDYRIRGGHEGALIVVPSRFTARTERPVHREGQRKRFWTDVLESLHLSLDTMLAEAAEYNETRESLGELDEEFAPCDLEQAKKEIETSIENAGQLENTGHKGIRIFDRVSSLGNNDTGSGMYVFRVTAEYREIAKRLNLYEDNSVNEGNPVKWIGRLFAMDAVFGELWFENWSQRERLASTEGIEEREDLKRLYILNPDRFADGLDGPCHTSDHRARFWRDVLDSLHLSRETLFEEARAKYRRELELARSSRWRVPGLSPLYYGAEDFDLERNIAEIEKDQKQDC